MLFPVAVWKAVAHFTPVQTVHSTAVMRKLAREWRENGISVAFVPTMGALHQGHASLIRRARRLAGLQGRVVVSIFVNPAQFAPHEDLAKYPRDLGSDRKLCRAAGADVVLVPSTGDIYPEGFSTYVVEESLSKRMEGASRPAHFRGVTTVVAKLFNLVHPGVAVFGEKDFQQAAIVQRMARDLNFPVRIVVAPTCRERDGLAMSSRNRYLDLSEREQATVLWRVMQEARALVSGGSKLSAGQMRRHLARLIGKEPAARIDYIEFFDPETLSPVSRPRPGIQIALAVFIGKTRLIDNARL